MLFKYELVLDLWQLPIFELSKTFSWQTQPLFWRNLFGYLFECFIVLSSLNYLRVEWTLSIHGVELEAVVFHLQFLLEHKADRNNKLIINRGKNTTFVGLRQSSKLIQNDFYENFLVYASGFFYKNVGTHKEVHTLPPFVYILLLPIFK